MEFVYIFVALMFGLVVGFALHYWLVSRSAFVGTIHIFEREDKIVCSLDLEIDPEEIMYRQEAAFKVDSSKIFS